MKHQVRRITFVGIITIICGLMASPVYAGKNAGSGDGVLIAIKNNPCGNYSYSAGGLHSVPVATCAGHKGAGQASMQVLIRGWDIVPEYPIANVPFVLGVGIDPFSAGVYYQKKATLTYPNQIKFTGYRTELLLEPLVITSPYSINGLLGFDSSVNFNNWWNVQTMDPSFVGALKVYSASQLDNESYPGGSDTFIFGLQGLTSSYHAVNPSTYKGEPAYRLGITSVYILSAKASWDYYQEWEVVDTVTKDVCRSGRNAEGLYDCVLTPGASFLNGHTIRVKTDIYGWGKVQDKNGGTTGYKSAYQITTDKVRWPDGTIHDHIPILVYQSQPLLQKP